MYSDYHRNPQQCKDQFCRSKDVIALNNNVWIAIEIGTFSIVGLPYTVYIVSGILERITF